MSDDTDAARGIMNSAIHFGECLGRIELILRHIYATRVHKDPRGLADDLVSQCRKLVRHSEMIRFNLQKGEQANDPS
jgi:hypothetical protein